METRKVAGGAVHNLLLAPETQVAATMAGGLAVLKVGLRAISVKGKQCLQMEKCDDADGGDKRRLLMRSCCSVLCSPLCSPVCVLVVCVCFKVVATLRDPKSSIQCAQVIIGTYVDQAVPATYRYIVCIRHLKLLASQ